MTCTTRAAETWAHIVAEVDPMPVSIAADFATDDGSEPAEACAAVEAVAQAHLDAKPDDHRARRLLGEWLAWHGDERGDGLRALAACGRLPDHFSAYGATHGHETHPWWRGFDDDGYYLPRDWFDQLRDYPTAGETYRDYRTRRAAEDAAVAFLRLPEARRLQLMKGAM